LNAINERAYIIARDIAGLSEQEARSAAADIQDRFAPLSLKNFLQTLLPAGVYYLLAIFMGIDTYLRSNESNIALIIMKPLIYSGCFLMVTLSGMWLFIRYITSGMMSPVFPFLRKRMFINIFKPYARGKRFQYIIDHEIIHFRFRIT